MKVLMNNPSPLPRRLPCFAQPCKCGCIHVGVSSPVNLCDTNEQSNAHPDDDVIPDRPFRNDWENFMPSPTYTNIWHDWHNSLIWGYKDKTADWIMTEGVALIAADIAKWTGAPLIIGEWCWGMEG